MAKPYSNDLRARVIEAIEEGATREEAAERHHVRPSRRAARFSQFDCGSTSCLMIGLPAAQS